MMRHLLFAAAFCLPLCAAVDGTVINQTTGKPQAGVTVTLFNLGKAGMEQLESAKSGADGKFSLQAALPAGAPALLQAAFQDVTYNQMLSPGVPTSGVTVGVFSSARQPGGARISQHMMLFEPVEGQITISESYVFQNDGKTTYDDPQGGVLKAFIPEGAQNIQAHATAPQGVALRRPADKTGQPNVYKVSFPIKPGESRIDLSYTVPSAPDGTFKGKVLASGPTRLVVPNGVTLEGDKLTSIGQEPRTQANIYDLAGTAINVKINGTGTLSGLSEPAADAGDGGQSPGIDQIMPRVFAQVKGDAGLFEKLGSVKWILLLTFAILALGFVLLYRQEAPALTPAKEANDRRRR